jgi:excisionase family DNA binding protein
MRAIIPPIRRELARKIEIDGHRLAYGVAEAAQLCGVSRSSLFEEIREGRLNSVMRAGRRLILHEDLMAWLRSGSQLAAPPGR